MKRCPACGTPYPAEARFCTRDGSKLEQRQTMNVAPSPPPPSDTVPPWPGSSARRASACGWRTDRDLKPENVMIRPDPDARSRR